MAIDLARWHLVHGVVTDEQTGEPWRHDSLQDGEVVVVDRGYNQVDMWMEHADRGVGLGVRYNAPGVNLYDAHGNKIDGEPLPRETTAATAGLPVQVRTKQQTVLDGHLHAFRRRRRKVAHFNPEPWRWPRGPELDEHTTGSAPYRRDHGPGPGPVASGAGD